MFFSFYKKLILIFTLGFIGLNVVISPVHAQTNEVALPTPVVKAQVAASPQVASSAADVFVPEPNISPLSLTVSPVSLLIETDPGVPVTTSFQVLNTGTETEYLKVTLLKFESDETGSSPVIVPFDATDQQQQWLAVSPDRFDVAPNIWKTLTVSFLPPQDAALSYYYALMVSRQVDQKPANGETGVVGAPALLALTTVRSPLAKQELQLKHTQVYCLQEKVHYLI